MKPTRAVDDELDSIFQRKTPMVAGTTLHQGLPAPNADTRKKRKEKREAGSSPGAAPKVKRLTAGAQPLLKRQHGHTCWSAPRAVDPAILSPGAESGARTAGSGDGAEDGGKSARVDEVVAQRRGTKKSNQAVGTSCAATPSAGRPSKSASKEAASMSAEQVPGGEVGQVLLILGLPLDCSEQELQRHFGVCAPLQVSLLHDWASKKPRGAACLALTNDAAVARALDPKLTHFRAANQLQVCDANSSARREDSFGGCSSPAMRTSRAALEARTSQALGSLPVSVRHLLLCCEHSCAAAAVDEFCKTVSSGAVRNPLSLLLTTLLRHRRASGGEVWLGRVNGLPLPAAPVARLHRILEALDWSAMPAEGKLRGAMAEQSFKLGVSTKAWSRQNGPYERCAFKEGMGVWDATSVTRRHAEVWKAASELIAAIDPHYPWTSVQFNKNFRGVRHRDEKDASFQVATAFGDYTGGELRVHGQNGIQDVNTRGRFVRFDGRFEHEVLPYEGTRYSVIYFQVCAPSDVDALAISTLAQL